SQNFDGVISPGLPAGWTVAQTGGGTAWVTSGTLSDTAPRAAFAAEPITAGSCELVSPPISLRADAAQVSFKNNFNTEPNTSDATAAYDGGVLEISIAGGSYNDIVAAGGSFVSGGYTRTIRTTENPLNGRATWAGASGGFISTVAKLPRSAAGQ